MFEGIPDAERSGAGNRSTMLVGAGGLLATAVVLVLLAAPNRVPWVVADGKLQIHARFVWSEDYPVCDLQTGQAQVLNLTRESGWLPVRKIYGFNGAVTKPGVSICEMERKLSWLSRRRLSRSSCHGRTMYP